MGQRIVVLPGDGIGLEVTRAAQQILREVASRAGLELELQEFQIGGQALEAYGDPLPDFVLEACREAQVVLLGAVGDDRYSGNPPHLRPERALLQLRKELGLFANLRPVICHPPLIGASPLKEEIVRGVDILIVRELTGGIYFGEPRGEEVREGRRVAFNSEVYYDYEVERIAKVAFEAARNRRRKVVSVDKVNVLESSRLWRSVVEEVHPQYPDVQLQHLLVDNCAMQLIARPSQFDVLLTSNMFGDILSDEAAMLTGSIGMLPSASLGAPGPQGRIGLYEPVHGTAPDIAGQDKANPLAAIASVALLLRYSLQREDLAGRIERAVAQVLEAGYRTPDIATPGCRPVGTQGMTQKVLEALSA